MIGIVTLNPCVDKTLFLPELPAEGIHTADRVTCLAGGKGNNVSRVLGALGVPRRSLVMIAGESGAHIRRMMEAEGIPARFIEVPGMSRTITTLTGNNWRQLAVKETGPQLTAEDAGRVKQAFLSFLDGLDFLCLAGTVSCPELAGFPRWAVEEAKKRGIPVLLDTNGAALSPALSAGPDYAKPNGEELSEAWSLPMTPETEAAAVRRMMAMGIARPILSLGERGALAGDEGRVLRVIPPPVRTVNPVGSGDSFVAGLLYGVSRGMDFTDCLRWAAAAGAANAARWEAACMGRGDIEPLVPEVTVTPLDD